MSDEVRPDDRKPTSRTGRFRLIVLVPVFALIALAAWALASPIGSSPDDDYHLASIWCANAADTSACQPGPTAATRYVPQAVHRAPLCYRFKADVSAACQSSDFSWDPAKKVLTDRGSFAGSYPPVYYAAMSVFVGNDIQLSAVIMRIVNALLFVIITTLLFVLLPRSRRPALIWTWLLTTVPLGMFLLASNNPSAWAIIGVGSLWIALLGYFETTGRRRVGLGVVSAATAVMAAGARADGAAYVAVVTVVIVVLTFRRERGYYLSAILAAALVVVAAFFYLTSGQSSVATTGLYTPGATPAGAGTLLFYNLENLPSLWIGSFGVWDLGWIDTPMPYAVIFGAVGAVIVVVFTGLTQIWRRKLLAVALVAAVLVLLPLYVLQQGHSFVGQAVQPRYLLPLIIVFVGIAVLPARNVTPRRAALRWGRVPFILIGAALVVSESVALHENMRRYITGTDAIGLNLNHGIEWWWPIGISPIVVWIAGSLAFAAVVVILLREITLPHRIASELDENPLQPSPTSASV